MKITCLQENLAKGLSIVNRVADSRSSLPILSNVLFQTEGDRLMLSATNLEIGITSWIGARVEIQGGTTLPASLLSDVINSLPPERLDLSLDEDTQTTTLTHDRFTSNIKGIDTGEFPAIPTTLIDPLVNCLIDADVLKQAITLVSMAAATDESRPILCGICLEFDCNKLTLTGTDGFRLSIKTITIQRQDIHDLEPTRVVIPVKALTELSKLISSDDETIELTCNDRQALFHFNNIDLIAQLLTGAYPDVTGIIPTSHVTQATLPTKLFLNAAQVSHLFVRDTANIIKLEFNTESLTLNAAGQTGDSISILSIDTLSEEPNLIAFNSQYLIALLKAIPTEQVTLSITALSSPGLFTLPDDPTFTHIIMPMSIRDMEPKPEPELQPEKETKKETENEPPF